MKKTIEVSLFLIFLILLLSITGTSHAADTINTTQMIRDGESVVSSGREFELGFFSPGSSMNRYVGIWFSNATVTLQTPVWVANRGSPLRNTTSGVLRLTPSGQLILQDGDNSTVWSSNNTLRVRPRNPVVQLLDSGNLVIREANDDRAGNYLWQSFDYPTDTFLQDMDYGWNLDTGIERYATSWRSSDDPAPGEYSFHLDITGYPQLVIRRGNSTVLHRLGPWNGVGFSGIPSVRPNARRRFRGELVINRSLVYYREVFLDRSAIETFTLIPSGVCQRSIWSNQSQGWFVYYSFPADICDNYRFCGAHGSCNVGNSPACGCLDGFVPRNAENWARSEWSDGCVRRTNLSCQGDVFLRYTGIKMPDSRFTRYNESMNLGECREVCSRNCSCTAYANLDITNGGSGCLMWFGELVDIRVSTGNESALYIRMSASELVTGSDGNKRRTLIAVLTSLAGMVVLGASLMLFIRKRKKNNQKLGENGEPGGSDNEDFELPTFDLSTLNKATDSFSISNQLGQGGFGPVYKGILANGKEIAIKRLSRTSMQGLDEFKNEVICIAKLQHRNLVRLLGCCIQAEEKMLIYEYMPNKSLDFFLFDQTKSKQLDWPKRFHIINGIARGILYLHQDSRLRIIHRDLKASNILLDSEMNPKISDFGMARIFGGNETEANTNRVVGTYGYMPPEYAVDGLFSLKSDVYSFGVLVLEIMSGQKNRGFHHEDHHHNLVGHAWILYKEGRSLELVDAILVSSFNVSELLRSIHVALLCVQQSPEDRPNMSTVVLMLGSDGALPTAKQPGFFTERDVFGPDSTSSNQKSSISLTFSDSI